jgi:hypothetical protein
MYTKLFEFKKWLNMEPKTDKENRGCDDIAFLSEIIANSRYWQETCSRRSVKLGLIFEHIITLTELPILNISQSKPILALVGNTQQFQSHKLPI